MKRVEEQSYYEILEVTPTATVKEIQKAYDRARETFSPDSMAVYSLFTEEEIKRIQAAIEEAYRVLMDEVLRKSYDTSRPQEVERPPDRVSPLQEKKTPLSFTDISLDVGHQAYRGKTLKQIREQLGIELVTVSSETRIQPKVLDWIEDEAVDKLPALVYLKGFLKSYAACLGLDPQKVVEGYLKFLEEVKRK